MGAQVISDPSTGDICRRVDEWLSCHASGYMTYHTYLVGQEPDMDMAGKVMALRGILCERGCGLCPDETDKLMEQLKKAMS